MLFCSALRLFLIYFVSAVLVLIEVDITYLPSSARPGISLTISPWQHCPFCFDKYTTAVSTAQLRYDRIQFDLSAFCWWDAIALAGFFPDDSF